MRVLLFAIGLFAVAFMVHCMLWRLIFRRRERLALLAESALAIGVFLLLFVGITAASLIWATPAFFPQTLWEWVHVSIFYFAASLTYTGLFFPLLHGGSPSLAVVQFIHAGRGIGRSQEEVQAILGVDDFLTHRLRQMVVDGLLVDQVTGYRLTSKGRRTAKIFHAMAAVLGLREGG